MTERISSSRAREIQNINHTKTLSSNLFKLRENDSLCDVTLISDGVEIRAHRVVLAACSEYFHAMFTSGLSETGKDEVKPYIVQYHFYTNLLILFYFYL